MAKPRQARAKAAQVGRLGLGLRLVRSNDFGQLGGDQTVEELAPAGISDWPMLLSSAATRGPDSRVSPPRSTPQRIPGLVREDRSSPGINFASSTGGGALLPIAPKPRVQCWNPSHWPRAQGVGSRNEQQDLPGNQQ